jgi:hypothetical protein
MKNFHGGDSPMSYNGYLKSHLPLIKELLSEGHSISSIAKQLLDAGVKSVNGEYYRDPVSSLGGAVRFAISREGLCPPRRSAWDDIVPPFVASRQVAWERCATIRRAAECGLTLKQIGKRFNISVTKVRQILNNKKRSPVELYLRSKDDVQTLAYKVQRWEVKSFCLFDCPPTKQWAPGEFWL